MKKIKGVSFWRKDWFITSTNPDKPKFLVINTHKIKNYYGSLSSCEVAQTDEFNSEAEALDFLENHISKADQRHTRVFKEVVLTY